MPLTYVQKKVTYLPNYLRNFDNVYLN